MSERTCKTCKWWRKPFENSDYSRYYFEGKPRVTLLGTCVRFPPIVPGDMDRPEFDFPTTSETTYCGEYSPEGATH